MSSGFGYFDFYLTFISQARAGSWVSTRDDISNE